MIKTPYSRGFFVGNVAIAIPNPVKVGDKAFKTLRSHRMHSLLQ
ncbi:MULTISPECIES: hypothetical protein [unclassified Trichocoleus]|nr:MULTISPECIES: hypothetical protein [unclassified Trichocoleus]